MAYRAMVCDVGKFIEMTQRHAAPCLFLVQEGLDQ